MKAESLQAGGNNLNSASQSSQRQQPLLVLPGMICNERSWSGVLDLLGDCVIPHVVDYGLASSVIEMARTALRAAPDRFLLAGHSMGARVAMEVCRLAPERVSGLCLIGTEYRACPPGEAGLKETQGRLALLDTARRSGMEAMARGWVPALIPQSCLDDRALVDDIVAMIASHTPEQLAAHIEAGTTRPDSSAVLRGLTVPTLLVAGGEDVLRPPEIHREMAALIRDSRLVVLDRCGHLPMMQDARAVAMEMRSWIERRIVAP